MFLSLGFPLALGVRSSKKSSKLTESFENNSLSSLVERDRSNWESRVACMVDRLA